MHIINLWKEYKKSNTDWMNEWIVTKNGANCVHVSVVSLARIGVTGTITISQQGWSIKGNQRE